MKSQLKCSQPDMFGTPTAGPIVLELKGIQVPQNKSRKDQLRKTNKALPPNCHVPSKKN